MKLKVLMSPRRYFYLCLLRRDPEHSGTKYSITTRFAGGPECCVVISYSQLPLWTQTHLLALEVYLKNLLIEYADASRVTFYEVNDVTEQQVFPAEEVVEIEFEELPSFLKRCKLFDPEVLYGE